MALVAYYSFQNKVVQVFSVLLVAGAGSLVQTGLVLLALLMMTQMGLVGLVLLLVLVGLVGLVLLLVLAVLLVLEVLVQVGLEVASNYLLLLDLELLVSALLDRKLWCKTEIK